MRDYFTTAKIKETLFHAEECGINTMLMRADMHIYRIIHEYRADGGKMNWICMSGSEYISFDSHINVAMQYKPDAIYHHGSVTDALFKAGEYDELKRRLKYIRGMGVAVGLGTHMPEVVEYAEDNNWDVDFYMTCIFNLSRQDRVSSAITGEANTGEIFDEVDPPIMYKTIRSASKPCLAFKILGAERRCNSQESVKAAFKEAYSNIKPMDAAVVGVFPRDIDQLTLDCRYVCEALSAK